MAKHIFIFLSFCITAFALLSCPITDDTTPPPPLPKAILIDFSFKNETQSPITVKIRHKYHWIWIGRDTITVYTDWLTETVASGERKKIGIEKTEISDAQSTWEAAGFFLLNESVEPLAQRAQTFFSSFELEIEMADGILLIPDDTVYTHKEPNSTDHCYLRINNPYNTCDLVTYKQNMRVKKLFTLPVTLTLQTDGTLAFEHETVSDSDEIHIFPNSPED